ncbi:hypothetical protein ADIARSV_3728 [Arcticibacter svalbardensis MN12-7]|uniref:Acyl carrier protein phosphodiesterase n=1 Tax=Arcticibacter svalbardensis MN12-7 TaxID=1150600 RepID=R9GMP9_9SPHI|nr:hypothetical protein [Arcticibacter svalbardensis]EOR93107.1 hypothetical protein ADIARSV_3728 [Arcticibacter svalbardensis MN12-7]
MNFLSHYYFDRFEDNPYRIMGMVLPDLIKNANKNWNPRPEKKEYLFVHDSLQILIMEGWKRHLQVDRSFHSSAFFRHHTHILRLKIAPYLESSAVRPSFVAHIALELMLDNLLLTELHMDSAQFYHYLKMTDRKVISDFLLLNDIPDSTIFFKFLDEFIKSKYLESYRNPKDIMYAIGKICLRVWPDPFNEEQKLQLTLILISYLEELRVSFITIFDQIEVQLEPYTEYK